MAQFISATQWAVTSVTPIHTFENSVVATGTLAAPPQAK